MTTSLSDATPQDLIEELGSRVRALPIQARAQSAAVIRSGIEIEMISAVSNHPPGLVPRFDANELLPALHVAHRGAPQWIGWRRTLVLVGFVIIAAGALTWVGSAGR